MDIQIGTQKMFRPSQTQVVSAEEKTAQPEPSDRSDPMKECGLISSKKNNRNGNFAFLNIIGHIEGHIVAPPNTKTTKYEHVIPYLENIAQDDDIEGLMITLNTVGGDVEAGLAIAELISNIGKPSVSLVLGGGHSIGVPLAVAADYSFIAKSASMTIHPVRMSGTLVGTQQTYDYFNKVQERILEFIVENSGISKERLREIMLDTEKLALDVGTVLIGEEAVKEGLISDTGGLDSAIKKLYELIAVNRKTKESVKKPETENTL